MGNTATPSANHEDFFYIVMLQTFMQHTFANHARGASKDSFNFHFSLYDDVQAKNDFLYFGVCLCFEACSYA